MATLTDVESSASSVILFEPAGEGNGRTVFNESTAVLYLAYAPTASETAYTVQLDPGAYYEFPAPLFLGAVSGIWASANGYARLTSW